MEEKPDDRLAIPLDPEEALRALLKVDPDSEPVNDDGKDEGNAPADQGRRRRPSA
jgi:hypothetical protein